MSSKVWNNLACSYCGAGLGQDASSPRCISCGLRYRYTPTGALDLRLKRPRTCSLEFELGAPRIDASNLQIEPLRANSKPEVAFANMSVPHRMTRELMSYFPKAKAQTSLMLDLGCGDGIHKALGEAAGFEWVGVDYAESSKASVLADAHALPFKDNTFEFILSVASMQLFRYPFVMMKEAHRVLKPGGVFLGTVAFLEPFHDDGFYHHTHLGTLNSLQYGGFTVEKLAPSEDWTGLTAQASMALFPKMSGFMSRSIVYPVQLLHKLWWKVGSLVTRNPNAAEDIRIRNTTAAFAFVASKRGNAPMPHPYQPTRP